MVRREPLSSPSCPGQGNQEDFPTWGAGSREANFCGPVPAVHSFLRGKGEAFTGPALAAPVCNDVGQGVVQQLGCFRP